MDVNAKGLRVIVTAGAGGIGKVTAETFLQNGAKVFISDVDDAAMAAMTRANPALGATVATSRKSPKSMPCSAQASNSSAVWTF